MRRYRTVLTYQWKKNNNNVRISFKYPSLLCDIFVTKTCSYGKKWSGDTKVENFGDTKVSSSKQTLSKIDKTVSMSTRVTRDEIDGGITNLVFGDGNRERPPWRCCSITVFPRTEIIFFVQLSNIVPWLVSFLQCSSWYRRVANRNHFGLLCFRV